jgi:uncharacterized membrane protein (DUF485 family)
MFSAKLERREQFQRLAIFAAASVFLVGSGLIAFGAMRAFTLFEGAEANSTQIILGILLALAGLIVLCVITYVAVRVIGRLP